MARRGSNSFKRHDPIRALRSAREAGIRPAMLEVVVPKGGSATYRVYGNDALPTPGERRTWHGVARRDRQAEKAEVVLIVR
jgi:hypothetical protein